MKIHIPAGRLAVVTEGSNPGHIMLGMRNGVVCLHCLHISEPDKQPTVLAVELLPPETTITIPLTKDKK